MHRQRWKPPPQKPSARPRRPGCASFIESEVAERLTAKFGYRNPMEVPRLEKVTLNMGIGEAKKTTSVLEAATEQLGVISGQRPNVRRARKSIA